MKPKKFIILCFIILCFFIVGKVNEIRAYESSAGHNFYIELPDGSTEELKGIQMIGIGHDYQGGFYYFSACDYEYEFDPNDPNYSQAILSQCISKSSCNFTGHFMPYMPGYYNSPLSVYVWGNYWNANVPPGKGGERCSRDSNDPNFLETSHAYFYGTTFADRFPWFPYEDRNPRGSDHAYWSGRIDSYCTGSNCPGVPWVSSTGYSLLLKDMCCEPEDMVWYGRDDRPSWAEDDIGEVINEAFTGSSYNQWHMNMTWMLKLGTVPPVTTVTGPNDCHKNTNTFTITAEDNDFDLIKEVELILTDDGTPYTYSFNLENGTFSEPAGSPFEIESPTIPVEGSPITINLTVTNLEELGYHQYKTISYRARAKEEAEWGEWNEWQEFHEEWYYPSPAISSTPDYENQTMEVTYTDNGSKANECLWSVSSESNNETINNDWPNIRSDNDLPALGTGQCSGSYSFSPASDDNYTFYLTGEGGLCGADNRVSSGSVYESPDAWVMTGWGDTYVYKGVMQTEAMKMWKITGNDFSIPDINEWAYFSTYILSKSDFGGSFPTTSGDGDGESKRGFILDKYDDMNREIIGDGGMYGYLKEISEENECTSSNCEVINSMPSSCSGKKVYFVDGSLNITSNFYESTKDDACVFIVKDNISVTSGVSSLEGFFLTDGLFATESAGSQLEINGGVISENVNFGRYLDNNYTNPAEVLSYDSKYLDLLREYLGEGYPQNIREWKYSSGQ